MKKRLLVFLFAFILLVTATGCGKDDEPQTIDKSKLLSGKHYAVITVKDLGDIKLELDADTAPITVTNFVTLAKDGFYDGLTFHRIIEGFMIQGGAPKNNESVASIKGEFSKNGIKNDMKHERGVISMARTDDPDSASSQFFIMHEKAEHLDGLYAAFGRVTDGMDIVDRIAENTPSGYNGAVDSANQPIITSIKIVDEE